MFKTALITAHQSLKKKKKKAVCTGRMKIGPARLGDSQVLKMKTL